MTQCMYCNEETENKNHVCNKCEEFAHREEKKYERIGKAYGQMTVYRLCGEDVLAFLADMKVLKGMADDEAKDFIDYVSAKLEIPFVEYFSVLLLEYLAMRGVTRSEITDERTV